MHDVDKQSQIQSHKFYYLFWLRWEGSSTRKRRKCNSIWSFCCGKFGATKKTFPSQFCRWKKKYIIFFLPLFCVVSTEKCCKKTNRTRKKYNVDCGCCVGGWKCRARWGRGRHLKTMSNMCALFKFYAAFICFLCTSHACLYLFFTNILYDTNRNW
jgi:hypothetical protein